MSAAGVWLRPARPDAAAAVDQLTRAASAQAAQADHSEHVVAVAPR